MEPDCHILLQHLMHANYITMVLLQLRGSAAFHSQQHALIYSLSLRRCEYITKNQRILEFCWCSNSNEWQLDWKKIMVSKLCFEKNECFFKPRFLLSSREHFDISWPNVTNRYFLHLTSEGSVTYFPTAPSRRHSALPDPNRMTHLTTVGGSCARNKSIHLESL